MPLSQQAKDLLFTNRGKPIVGLIHKKTNEIVLAPCIPEKIYIELDSEGQAIAGDFLNDDGGKDRSIANNELNHINALLKTGHVPRLAKSSKFEDKKSSHEFLFDQASNTTSRQEWGGFTVTLDFSGIPNYTFVSGAFNSRPGKRMKGAELNQILIEAVKTQISGAVNQPKNTETAQIKNFICVTPEKKRQCTKSSASAGSLVLAFSGSLFYTNENQGNPNIVESSQPSCETFLILKHQKTG